MLASIQPKCALFQVPPHVDADVPDRTILQIAVKAIVGLAGVSHDANIGKHRVMPDRIHLVHRTTANSQIVNPRILPIEPTAIFTL